MQKGTFKYIFIMLAIILALLPFVVTFNSALTEFFNWIGWYRLLQDTLVPFESRIVVILLNLLSIKAYLAPVGDQMSFYLLQGDKYLPIRLEWNCLGWQSLLLLITSFFVGLQGKFTKISSLECILIGILGTFLINISRMVFISAGIFYINDIFTNLIHDYFAAFVTVIWLMIFWWFSYRFVLEEKEEALIKL